MGAEGPPVGARTGPGSIPQTHKAGPAVVVMQDTEPGAPYSTMGEKKNPPGGGARARKRTRPERGAPEGRRRTRKA